MTTYTFQGYNFSDYVPVSGAPAVGATFRIRSTFDASTDAVTFTIDDDDTALAGSSGGSLDATLQSGTVTNAAGTVLYSGTLRVGWEATFTAPDGSTLHVWDVWTGTSGGTRIGLIADGEIPPGVTFQISTYVDTGASATWPLYAAVDAPSTDPDLAQTISGGTLADSLYGGAGNDSLSGGAGNDTISGEAGDDTIVGGGGNDILTGGADRDQFIFYDGFGHDTVTGSSLAGSSVDDDSMDFAALSSGITVTFTGTEAGTVAIGSDGANSVSFSEIEAIEGTLHADSINAAADSWGVYLGGDAGNDTITGGAGDDTIEGGADHDTIRGGEGADAIWGDAGNDTLDGGAGADTLRGGTGGDSLQGGTGNDSLLGGTGNDQIWGDDGADTLSGGAGDDTLAAGAGNDLFQISDTDDYDAIDGGTETDSLRFSTTTSGAGVTVTYSGATSGSYDFDGSVGHGIFDAVEQITGTDVADTFDATGAGAGVTLDGAGGDDAITGSAAADTLAGGAGNDTLTGGLGDDSLTGGTGLDEIVLGAGGGIDTLSDFDFTANGWQTTDQLDTSALTGGSGVGGLVTARDVVVGVDPQGYAVLTFPTGEQLVLAGVGIGSVDTPGKLHAMGLPCYVAGTMIATPEGPRPIEEITAGMRVLTRDHGAQPVLWRSCRTISPAAMAARPRLRPVELQPGAFGNARALRLSAQHGVVVGAALVRAVHLAEAAPERAMILPPTRAVSYHHLLLPAHALLRAEGVWAESLWPGPMACTALTPRDRCDLLRQFPELAAGLLGLAPVEHAYGARALPLLRRRDLRTLPLGERA